MWEFRDYLKSWRGTKPIIPAKAGIWHGTQPVIPAKAGNQNPVAGKIAFAANGLWIPAKAGMTMNMTTLPR